MLAAVGVGARVVGVDAFTNYPASLAAKPGVNMARMFLLVFIQ